MPQFTRFHRLILCGGAAALVYFIGLGRPALWEPDEGRYAEIAREMVVSGDYLTPRNDWVRYFEKPPLVYWATAASIKLLGRDELAVRTPAALASVGTVMVTAALGEAMFDAATGLLAAITLALSPLFFIFARFATPDPELTFFFSAGLAAFFAAVRERDLRHGAGRKWMVLAAAALALGTLAKGPVALVLGGGIGLLWMLSERRAREIAQIRWLECGAIYLAITAPWFIVAGLHNPGFIRFFLVHEHLQRFVESTEHGWGPWFFFPIVPAGFWPWLYFVFFGVAEFGDARVENRDGARGSGVRFLLIWFTVVFIFFSIPRSKLGEYILPALPPLALLAAIGLLRVRAMEARRACQVLGWFAATNLTLLLGAIAVWIAWRSGLARADGFSTIPLGVVVLALVWGSAATIIYLAARWWRSARNVPWGVTIVAMISAAILARARTEATPMASYRELAGIIDPYLQRGCTLASYRHFVQALPFYTQTRERLVGYRGELAPFGESDDAAESFIATDARLRALWSGPRCVILIANRKDVAGLAARLQPPPSLLGGEGKKVALTNRSTGATPSPSPPNHGPPS